MVGMVGLLMPTDLRKALEAPPPTCGNCQHWKLEATEEAIGECHGLLLASINGEGLRTPDWFSCNQHAPTEGG